MPERLSAKLATTTSACARATTTMTSNPDTPTSSHVAPDSFSGELMPGLPGHLVVAHVLEEEKMPDPTDGFLRSPEGCATRWRRPNVR